MFGREAEGPRFKEPTARTVKRNVRGQPFEVAKKRDPRSLIVSFVALHRRLLAQEPLGVLHEIGATATCQDAQRQRSLPGWATLGGKSEHLIRVRVRTRYQQP